MEWCIHCIQFHKVKSVQMQMQMQIWKDLPNKAVRVWVTPLAMNTEWPASSSEWLQSRNYKHNKQWSLGQARFEARTLTQLRVHNIAVYFATMINIIQELSLSSISELKETVFKPFKQLKFKTASI